LPVRAASVGGHRNLPAGGCQRLPRSGSASSRNVTRDLGMESPEDVSLGPAARRSRSVPAPTRVRRSVLACESLGVYRICRIECVQAACRRAGPRRDADGPNVFVGLRPRLATNIARSVGPDPFRGCPASSEESDVGRRFLLAARSRQARPLLGPGRACDDGCGDALTGRPEPEDRDDSRLSGGERG
jgi:hypothetical protein